MPAFRVKLGANDLNCWRAVTPYSLTHSRCHSCPCNCAPRSHTVNWQWEFTAVQQHGFIIQWVHAVKDNLIHQNKHMAINFRIATEWRRTDRTDNKQTNSTTQWPDLFIALKHSTVCCAFFWSQQRNQTLGNKNYLHYPQKTHKWNAQQRHIMGEHTHTHTRYLKLQELYTWHNRKILHWSDINLNSTIQQHMAYLTITNERKRDILLSAMSCTINWRQSSTR